MQIGRADVMWNYAATFLKIAAAVLLLPLIVRMMPAETVGVWTLFMTITSFVSLFDFGFNPSFTRNVTYVFSGVRELKATGYAPLSEDNITVDFGLLKGMILTMRWFYMRVSVLVFSLLITFGTWYLHTVLRHYAGGHAEVYSAWCLLCAISTFNLYTQYYDSLLQGKGLVKRSKQIVIGGQTVYLVIAIVLMLSGQRLVAIVAAQASSVVIVRLLSYRSFFTASMKKALNEATPCPKGIVLQAIYPNAFKVGLTVLGGFAVSRSAIVLGSLYLPLEQIASYGITMQFIGIISALATIYTTTFTPVISQSRLQNNLTAIRNIYLKGKVLLICTFISGGTVLICLGDWTLSIIGSHTFLMQNQLTLIALLITFLENNHGVAGAILLTGNEVPFFKASLIAGAVTIVLLLIFLSFTKLNLLGLLLAPGLAHLYNNWKWPYEVRKQLKISSQGLCTHPNK